MEPVPESVSAVHNATNATRDVESEFEAGQEGKIREIVMDNVDSEPMVISCFHFLLFLFCHNWLDTAAKISSIILLACKIYC